MLIVVPTGTASVLRPNRLSCRYRPATVEQMAAELSVADQVRVVVPNWRHLPRQLVADLRALDGSTVDLVVATASKVFESLSLRLDDLVQRLAVHDRHLLLGLLERQESDAPPRTHAVLAAVERATPEVEVLPAG